MTETPHDRHRAGQERVLRLHGAAAGGTTLFRRRVSRGQLERFMAAQPPCAVAMEACASAHHWARRMAALGHQVRLIAPACVRPFARRPKTDAADAEAIAKAAMRPSMRVNAPKSAEMQARAMLFRAREQVIKQRTETVDALRGHLAEFGLVAPAGLGNISKLATLIVSEEDNLPLLAREMARLHLDRIARLSAEVDRLTQRIAAEGSASPAARLSRAPCPAWGRSPPWPSRPSRRTQPRSPVAATSPPGSASRRASTSCGGKQRLGRTSKMGEP